MEKLDHLGLWEGLAERWDSTVTVLGRPDFISLYPRTCWKSTDNGLLWKYARCALGHSDRNLHSKEMWAFC